MKKNKKIVYVAGYNHYNRKRKQKITFMLNQCEYECLMDLLSVQGIRNMSAFIRGQIFRAYSDLTAGQKRMMADVAAWRENDKN